MSQERVHRYNGVLIGTYTCPTQQYKIRMSLSDLSDSNIFSDTGIAQPLYDS